MTSRMLLFEHETHPQPRWFFAEGFVKNGSADDRILVAQLLPEKTSEWWQRVWFLKAELS